MIIGIIGPPAVGKTTLLNSVTDSLGDGEDIEPTFLYRCVKYNEVLCLGQYDKGRIRGTDSWKYAVLAKGQFEKFIKEQVEEFRHIIFEGDRLTSKVQHLAENFDTKIFILKMSSDIEKYRQEARGNRQTPKWVQSRHTQMENLQNDSTLDGHLVVRENNTIADAECTKSEILKLLV